jgi:radical SAM superfamily enzyme YgiQ (UPF0313 family)
MHILFVVPGWPQGSFWDVLRFKFPPLSLATLMALTPAEHTLTYVDESLHPVPEEPVPDLVAITAMTPLAPRGYEIADTFRSRGSRVVIGGIHASNCPEEAANHADAVVIGEADEIWTEVLDDAASDSLKPVYRQNSTTDMSRLPTADRSYYPPKGYFFENIIQTTRGCPHRCEFCTVTAFFGGTYRTRPSEGVIREVRSLTRAPGYVFFADDNLAADRRHFNELLQELKTCRLRWICQASIHVAREPELLKQMAEAGCHGIFIGFESLDETNLRTMGKSQNNAAFYRKAIKRIHDQGIGVYGSFIFGYDHDTVDVFDRFLDFANQNRLDGAFLPVLTPFPGTRIHARLEQEGRILSRDWRLYDMATVVFQPKNMSVQELQEGFWKVNKGFYSVTSTLRRLFHPTSLGRRSNIIFMPMNIGHIPAVRRAHRNLRP